MRYITFIRHAKSSWASLDIADHDRPLAPRGQSDAPLIGKALRDMNMSPDCIYASTATRAQETAHAIARAIQYPESDIVSDRSLYLFTIHTELLLDILRGYNDAHQHIFVVGHNETMETLAREVSKDRITSFPTCAVLHCQVDIDAWADLSIDGIEDVEFITPKMLKNKGS